MARAPAADCEQGRQPQQGGPAVIDGKDGMPPVKTKAEWLCKADEPDGKGRQQQERHVVAVDEPVAASRSAAGDCRGCLARDRQMAVARKSGAAHAPGRAVPSARAATALALRARRGPIESNRKCSGVSPKFLRSCTSLSDSTKHGKVLLPIRADRFPFRFAIFLIKKSSADFLYKLTHLQ